MLNFFCTHSKYMVAVLNLLLWDGVLISLNNFLFFDIVDVKLLWKVKKIKI